MLRPGKRGVALESKGRQAAKVRKVSWKAEVSDDGSASVASDEVMDPGTPLSDSDDEQVMRHSAVSWLWNWVPMSWLGCTCCTPFLIASFASLLPGCGLRMESS
mmetsp:Transcript_20166/g.44848  ORF Transcript_20166/g.44848 Transcript_20166/m.44848 type:complete len:104 (-) Transcript_20166:149-460(-)